MERREDRIAFVLSRNIAADTWVGRTSVERRTATATASYSKGRVMAVP